MKYLISNGEIIAIIIKQEDKVEKMYNSSDENIKKEIRLVDTKDLDEDETFQRQYFRHEVEIMLKEVLEIENITNTLIDAVTDHLKNKFEYGIDWDNFQSEITKFLSEYVD